MSEQTIEFSKVKQIQEAMGTLDKDYEPVSYDEAMDQKWKCVICYQIREITDPDNWRSTQFGVWHGPICEKCWMLLTNSD